MKAELRARLHGLRNALTPEEREHHSSAITGRILSFAEYREAKTLMAYMTFGSEFVTGTLVRHALAKGKTLVLPKIDRAHNRLELFAVQDPESELAAGPWGIREPRPDRCRGVTIS